MEWVASTLHTTSEHGVSSITTADAHTSAASSWLNWRPRRFKWTHPFRRKTKSGFCVCAITFQTQSTAFHRSGSPAPSGLHADLPSFHCTSKFSEVMLFCANPRPHTHRCEQQSQYLNTNRQFSTFHATVLMLLRQIFRSLFRWKKRKKERKEKKSCEGVRTLMKTRRKAPCDFVCRRTAVLKGVNTYFVRKLKVLEERTLNPYPTAFPYGNDMVLHFYQQQESSTTKTVHKVINKGLKAYVQSPHTDENFH